MVRSRPPHGPAENHLLAQLPRADSQRLLPRLETVTLEPRQVLHENGQPIRHVYFPDGAAVSKVVTMHNGDRIESALVGREGVVGLPVFWGAQSSPGNVLVQVPGKALRLAVEDFRTEAQPGSALHELMRHYTVAVFAEVTQTAACNGLHSVRQRSCRWLLTVSERVGADDFPLTQEFLAQMLGVRRASVVEVARSLQRERMIDYRRGEVSICDRARLEAASCECYAVIRAHFRNSLP